ncbi:hypothetical protein KEM60_02801 [Austwickia sp. TVS 96-490-7B]|uniref:M23 family metallopeptidase n=1 Tax=Austwickia sp. TVS 96-490-7B TaxID=2830843 RepID=UPI001C583488|nr:M23 family metallopeptidase [Austwickia sp. TVS 96-490-7B]MBW3086573.1 hypothetical protein [Austwickia sp. TVS 96-490-7B]
MRHWTKHLGQRVTPDRRRWAQAVCAGSMCLVAAGLFGGTAVTYADDLDQDQQKVRSALEESQGKLAHLSARARSAVLALQATQAKLTEARQALDQALASEKAAQERQSVIEGELHVARRAEVEGLAKIAAIRAEQVRHADIRDNMARQAYEGAGLERLSAVLNTDRTKDLSDRMYIVEKVNDAQNVMLQELAEAKRRADEEQVKLAETRRRIAALKVEATAALRQAQESRQQADEVRSRLEGLENDQRKASEAVSAERAAEQERVAQLQAQNQQIQDRLAQRARDQGQNPSAPPPSGNGRFSVPVAGPFTSEFGWRINPVTGSQELHSGLDIGAGCGTPVYAAGDGVVIHAGWISGYGNAVWIDHGGGIVTTYNHMSGYAVSGGSVSRGQVIGSVGTTGQSTGCHMHWEVRVNGAPVNPRGWF